MNALIVEDESSLRRALCDALSQWGFEATAAAAGLPALATWQSLQPDVVLLDLGLPDVDGLDVLQSARRQGWGAPVLLLTARVTIGDRILGLNFGADDYLAKPFDMGELKARLLALLRRGGGKVSPLLAGADARRQLGELKWTGDGAFFCGDEPLGLTPREAALLRALVGRPNQALPKEALLKAVFPRGHVLEEALEVVAHRLRRKLAPCGVTIITLRGLGYLIKAAA